MNLCRCEQGHFYDKEKYASCPHCVGGSAVDDKRTEAFTEDFTVPVSNGGMNAPAAPMEQAPPPVAPIPPVAPVAPMPPVAPVAPPSNPLPMAGMSANQMTVAVNTMPGDDATLPLDLDDAMLSANSGIGGTVAPPPSADDDHTVGFFDDVFSNMAAEGPAAGPVAAKPVVNKVSNVNKVKTPCVGWLIALGGEHIGTDFRLKVGKNFVGRSPHMDIALTEDKSVSRESHAVVVYEPKAHLYLVQPGESSSLVYRNNDVVLTPVKLEAYDMITVGDINLLFIPLCGDRFNWGDLLEEMKKKSR